ncbi:MAG TPA: GntR family transcriptional regulator [Gaiellaceae bacterium]|jgi:DNA-binding GntR family transcriptional regulator|nr:GntR family transcriptional regulator [Gaiellaceae bacterium]
MTQTLHDTDLVDRLAATIQARILSGEIPSQARLRQASLAAEFGVSRTPVREALRKLQSAGVVVLEPRRGAVVRGTTPREVREAYLVRGELEGLAAELATPHISDDELEQLHEAQVLFRTAIEQEIANRRTGRGAEPWSAENDWERANNLFHEVIQRASGNRQLQLAVAHLHRSFPRHLTWAALSKSAHLLGDNVQQHSAIVEAIERRDPKEARRLMAQHVHDAGELVAVLLERSH